MIKMKKVILDTDISNEIDDQFALAYLALSEDICDIQAVTIAPFSNSDYMATANISDGTNLSYDTACKIFDLIGKSEHKSHIFKGAKKYFFESKETNEATDKIIELARKNDFTTILAIGAPTNIALALYLAPDIAEKIEIVWLGGNSLSSENNDEYNFRQDAEAVRTMFNSGAKLTVIPCKNVAAQLSTSVYELERYLSDCKIGKYLLDVYKDRTAFVRKSEADIIGESKVIWDISTVGYLVNKEWFEVRTMPVPRIYDDLKYRFIENDGKITIATDIKRDKIFNDFFVKVGRLNG